MDTSIGRPRASTARWDGSCDRRSEAMMERLHREDLAAEMQVPPTGPTTRARTQDDGGPAALSLAQLRDLGGGGRLPEELERTMGTQLGMDLSDVRVHTGSRSEEVADEMGARAFTVGRE